MSRSFKAILLLDDYSRAVIKTNISELGLHGISFINSLGELTDDLIQDNKTVIILEGYLLNNNSISDLRLYKSLFNLDYIYIGTDELYLKEMKDLAQIYHSDIKIIDIDILQAAVYNDTALETNATYEIFEGSIENQDFANTLLKNSENIDSKMLALAKEYLSLRSILSTKQDTIESLKNTNSILEVSLDKLRKENNVFLENYTSIINDSIKLNQTLEQFETILTKDIYEKLNLSNYNNRPMIIYLKEYEELIHLDSFIETLYYMFINQCHKSVKVLQLFDSTGENKIKILPSYYHKIRSKFLIQDLVVNNFISKTGDYRKVLEILLSNTSNLDVLIIVDRKNYMDTVLSGSYLQLALCRNYKNIDKYGLLPETTIVNNAPEEYLSWDYYAEYNNDSITKEQRFIYLAARPVIQKIYSLSKFYEESM